MRNLVPRWEEVGENAVYTGMTLQNAAALLLLGCCSSCGGAGGDGAGELATRVGGGGEAGSETAAGAAGADGSSYVARAGGGSVAGTGGATGGVGGSGGALGRGGSGSAAGGAGAADAGPVDGGPVYCVVPAQAFCSDCNVYLVGEDGGAVGGMVGSTRCVGATLVDCTLAGDVPGWRGVWRGRC